LDVVVDEAARVDPLAGQPAEVVLQRGERALVPDRDDADRPGERGEVQPDHRPPEPGQVRAGHDEGDEREVEEDDGVGEDSVDHGGPPGRTVSARPPAPGSMGIRAGKVGTRCRCRGPGRCLASRACTTNRSSPTSSERTSGTCAPPPTSTGWPGRSAPAGRRCSATSVPPRSPGSPAAPGEPRRPTPPAAPAAPRRRPPAAAGTPR